MKRKPSFLFYFVLLLVMLGLFALRLREGKRIGEPLWSCDIAEVSR